MHHQLVRRTKELTDAASSVLITAVIKMPSYHNTGDLLHVDISDQVLQGMWMPNLISLRYLVT